MKEWASATYDKGYIKSKAYKDCPATKFESDNIALSEDEIERIYRIDFTDP